MSTSGKEFTKTLLFVAVAVSTIFVASWTRPNLGTPTLGTVAGVGEPLFPEFTNPSMVTGLEVLSFNEELGSLSKFQIRQASEGEWVIPSKEGYPADAQVSVAKAATMFIDCKILKGLQDTDHERYGVVQPELGKTQLGDEGVGTLFKVRGKIEGGKETDLAELIIGNPVKDREGQYYVRRPGKSSVYTVEIEPTDLSTEFTDWIATKLLPIASVDVVESLDLQNYVLAPNENNELHRSIYYEARVRNQGESGWELDEISEYVDGKMQVVPLEEGEELNQSRLNFIQSAINSMEIRDVRRKGKRLAEQFRQGNLDVREVPAEQLSGMVQCGFYPYDSDDDPRVLAIQGELRINTKVGVQFQVLIGGLVGKANTAITGDTSLSRILMIFPTLYEEAFPEPELEELPADDAEMSDNDRKIAIERITSANETKIKEQQDKITQAERIVEAYRSRYSDWYFLVSEDIIRRLRVPRSELVKLSDEALEKGFGIEAFRKLQRDFSELKQKAE